VVSSAKRFLALAKRAASVCVIALATSGTMNRGAVVEVLPALPVAMEQVPRRSLILAELTSAALVASLDDPSNR
jgi:hypothetical protein